MKTNSKFLLFFSGLTASIIFFSYCNDLNEGREAQWRASLEQSRASTDKLVSTLDNLNQSLEKTPPPVEPDCEE